MDDYKRLQALWAEYKVPPRHQFIFVQSIKHEHELPKLAEAITREISNYETQQAPAITLLKTIEKREQCLKEIIELDRALYCNPDQAETYLAKLEARLKVLRSITIVCFELILAMSDQLKQSRLSSDDYFFKMREDSSDFADKAMGKYFNFASDENSNKIDPFLIIPGTEERSYCSNGGSFAGQTSDE